MAKTLPLLCYSIFGRLVWLLYSICLRLARDGCALLVNVFLRIFAGQISATKIYVGIVNVSS